MNTPDILDTSVPLLNGLQKALDCGSARSSRIFFVVIKLSGKSINQQKQVVGKATDNLIACQPYPNNNVITVRRK